MGFLDHPTDQGIVSYPLEKLSGSQEKIILYFM